MKRSKLDRRTVPAPAHKTIAVYRIGGGDLPVAVVALWCNGRPEENIWTIGYDQ